MAACSGLHCLPSNRPCCRLLGVASMHDTVGCQTCKTLLAVKNTAFALTLHKPFSICIYVFCPSALPCVSV
jgi:hypothetical protein